MPRRWSALGLRQLCLRSVAQNMLMWCKDFVDNFQGQGQGELLDVIGPFEELPPDLIQELIQTLVDLKLMRASFLKLLIIDRLKKLDLSMCRQFANNNAMANIIGHRCRMLTHLSLENQNEIRENALIKMASSLPLLRAVNLNGTRCGDQTVRALALNCHGLQEMSLAVCPVTDSGMLSLCVNPDQDSVEQLVSLDVDGTCVTVQGLKEVLRTFRNSLKVLQHPELCRAIAEIHLHNIENGKCTAIAQPYRLTRLLQHFSDFNTNGFLGPEQMINISIDGCIDAKEINLTNCEGFCSYEVMHSLTRLKEIRSISVTNFGSFPDAVLPVLTVHGPKLRKLELTESDEVSVHDIGAACPNLQYLRLTDVTSWSDGPVASPGPGTVMHKMFARLQELHVRYFNEEERIATLTENHLRVLLTHCISLTQLDLECVPSLTDELLNEILQENPLQHLNQLTLSKCHGITGEAIKELLHRDNDLSLLSLLYCQYVTLQDSEDMRREAKRKHFALKVYWC